MKLKTTRGIEYEIDKADYPLVSKYRWTNVSNTFSDRKYIRSTSKIRDRYMMLTHFLLGIPGKGMYIDHINNNSLDNRRANLRFCTHSQNMMNRNVQKNNKLGHKGIQMSQGKFRVRLYVNKKIIRGGRHANIESAIREREELARKHHGQFFRP